MEKWCGEVEGGSKIDYLNYVKMCIEKDYK